MSSHNLAAVAAHPWIEVSTAALQAELRRRQNDSDSEVIVECGSDKQGHYNTPIHIFALFLILVLSTVACGLPLISRRISTSPSKFIFLSQHFGTGVLIATAFVHLLPTAFISLTDPCLRGVWAAYKPMAGLIAMASALAVVAIEMFLRTRGAHHSHSHGETWDPVATEDVQTPRTNGFPSGDSCRQYGVNKDGRYGDDNETNGTASDSASYDVTPIRKDTEGGDHARREQTQEQAENESLDLELDEIDMVSIRSNGHMGQRHSTSQAGFTLEDDAKKQLLQCLLLEAGILFHSIFIGMAVSVATGTPFVVFLIAIAFHQTFEGIALGTRIAAINFPKSSPRPWLMVLAYGTTTPIGQAIGLGVHKLYDPQSEAGLLVVGIMNAISSGLLVFAGLVQLLAEDFLADKSYEMLQGKRRWHAYLCVIAGALLMALVGVWA